MDPKEYRREVALKALMVMLPMVRVNRAEDIVHLVKGSWEIADAFIEAESGPEAAEPEEKSVDLTDEIPF